MSLALSLTGTVRRLSKEGTNDNRLNNLRLALQRVTNLQLLLKTRQKRRVFDVANSLNSHEHETLQAVHELDWIADKAQQIPLLIEKA
jgi:hypothetical protein